VINLIIKYNNVNLIIYKALVHVMIKSAVLQDN
jgi:hypothetical protein